MQNLRNLCLRWNRIKIIENLQMLVTLNELDLYDNQITKIENLSSLVNLKYAKLNLINCVLSIFMCTNVTFLLLLILEFLIYHSIV